MLTCVVRKRKKILMLQIKSPRHCFLGASLMELTDKYLESSGIKSPAGFITLAAKSFSRY